MKISKVAVLIFLFFQTQSIYSQAILSEDELAKVGWLSITDEEFLERIEMTPQFNRQTKKFDASVKLEFLYTLIAEKLWAIEAENAQLDTMSAFKTAINSIEKMYVRDELFNLEVREKIIISEDDYIKAVFKNSKSYFVKYLFSTEFTEIKSLNSKLLNGIEFEELLKENRSSEDQNTPIEVIYGELIESIEDAVFNLKVGEISEILTAEDGFYIFKVYDIKNRIFENEEEEVTNYVQKILQERLGERIQLAFYKDFFKNLKVDVDKDIFLNLANKLKDIFSQKKNSKVEGSTNLLTIDAYDINIIKKHLGDQNLNSLFIKFSENPFTLNKFINEFFFDGFQIPPSDIERVDKILNYRIKIFIERELLAREGYKRNLQNNNRVKKSLSMWRDYYLSQAYLSRMVEDIKITDSEIEEYYNKEFADHESKTFSELKNNIKRAIAFEKAMPEILDNTVYSANEYEIEINSQLLNKLQITNINTFAIRVLGFGGKITAVPIIKPFTEWARKWKNKPQFLP